MARRDFDSAQPFAKGIMFVTQLMCGTLLLTATLVGTADAKCDCAAGTGNAWVTDRACGDWGTNLVLRDAIYPKVDQDCVKLRGRRDARDRVPSRVPDEARR